MGERGQQEADRHPHDQHCTPWGQAKEKKKRIRYKRQHSRNLPSGKDLFPNGCIISNPSHVYPMMAICITRLVRIGLISIL
jgi:hypothetical protein